MTTKLIESLIKDAQLDMCKSLAEYKGAIDVMAFPDQFTHMVANRLFRSKA